MTEAAQRKPVAKPARRLPVSTPVLWTGMALGTFLAILALTHGVMLPMFGGFADAIVTFVLLLAAGVVLTELTRRHHRAAASLAVRHGKRGTSAAYRGARRHGGRGAAFVAARARSQWASGAGRRRGRRQPRVPAETDPAHQSPNQTGGMTMGLVKQDDWEEKSKERDRKVMWTAHGIDITRQPRSRIKTAHRAQRAAARSGGSVPSEWGPVIAQTADFEPEDDGELLEWMNRQVTGLSAWAEALVDFYEHATNVIGIDPVASATLHDVADAAAGAAETMGAAKAKFTDHYELPREFAGNGGLMTHDGRWVTGEGA